MHIAVLSDPNNFHTRKWVRALVKAGAQVTVFSFDAGECEGAKTVQLSAPWKLGGKYTYLSYLWGGKVLRKALLAHQVQIVNALNITPFGVWAAKSGFKPCIYSALGADILEYPPKGAENEVLKSRSWANTEGGKSSLQSFKARILRGFYRKAVGRSLQFADQVTGDNQLLVDRMQDWFKVPEPKTRLLRWGVEPELFEVDSGELEKVRKKFGIEAGKKVVLSPRGAKAIYQADIILEAFRQLLEAGREDTHFIMLSAGYTISAKVAATAQALSERYPNFRFIPGLVPREEVYALWKSVDIMVSAPIYDGYSAAVAEARYAGVIPVVNAIPGNLEVIQHQQNGWVCEPFTAEKLAGDLGKILDELHEWKEKFATPNRNWITQHSLVDDHAREFVSWCEEWVGKES